jgi:hypothetical protein
MLVKKMIKDTNPPPNIPYVSCSSFLATLSNCGELLKLTKIDLNDYLIY